MELRKLVPLERFFSPVGSRRRVVSGFGVGVVASLLVFSLLVSLSNNNSPASIATASSSSSTLFSWFFSLPGASSDAKGGEIEKTHRGNSSRIPIYGGERNVEESSPGSSTVAGDLVEHFENYTGIAGNGTVSGKGTVVAGTQIVHVNETEARIPITEETTHAEVTSSSSKNTQQEGNLGKEGGVLENTHDGNLTGKGGNASIPEKAGVLEGNKTGVGSPGGGESISETTHVVNLSRGDNNTIVSVKSGIEEKTHKADFFDAGKNRSRGNGVVKELNGAAKVLNGAELGRAGSGIPGKCDIFTGRWVRDERKPFYPPGSCPHIDIDFNCHKNGRPDDDFLIWRWQPNDCDIPRLNGTDFLERLRGKRLIFVGDSLNRNMWESLVCILRNSVKNKKRVYEVSGRNDFKTKGYYSFRFKDYKCSVDFVRSPFLVRELYAKSINGLEDEKLRLDIMDETTSAYREADIVVFNTGHWWTHEKTSSGINYYQEGDHVYPVLKVMEAYKKALTTWARWVDKNINAKKTQVVFRGYSLTHFSGGRWNSGGQCHKETEPIFNETFLGKYPSKMRVLDQVLKQMKTPVIYLNISRLTDYRKDGHPSIYRKKYKSVEEQINAEKTQDCSHWCLPGIPDAWNELLYASLMMDGRGSWKT